MHKASCLFYAAALPQVIVLKILVLSDSHGCLGNMYDAVEREMPDRVFHLGDHLSDAEDRSNACPERDFL